LDTLIHPSKTQPSEKFRREEAKKNPAEAGFVYILLLTK
jgi:hypothetical protein